MGHTSGRVDADLLGIDLTDPRQLHEGGKFLMRTEHGDLDVFAVDQTAGAPRSYEQLRARAVPVEVFGVRILVAHPEDLIRMKSAASQVRDRPEPKRQQDRDDIAVLEQLRGRELERREAQPEPPTPRSPGRDNAWAGRRSGRGEAERDGPSLER